MRSFFVFCLLWWVKALSHIFFPVRSQWVGTVPERPWDDIRLAAILHHTSLFEPIFLSLVPNRLLWRMASKGVVPAADKTIARPLVGLLFRLFAYRVIPISRRRDETWAKFMDEVSDDVMVVMAPEGRMMRRNGLDLAGNPMTVRGGIADILQALGQGRMLLLYSGGLHHIQAPGQLFPRIFRAAEAKLEVVEISSYLRELDTEAGRAEAGRAEAGRTEAGHTDSSDDSLRAAVIRDLEARRDRHCPFPTAP